MTVVVHPKTQDIRNRLDQHGDVYNLIEEGVFQGEPAVHLQAVKVRECCGGRKYQYQAWFRQSEAEWEPTEN